MAASNDPLSHEEKEILLQRRDELEFVSDVIDFQCVRCRNVVINHYFATCGHVFCDNCRRILDDGSHRWKCTSCQQYITQISEQKIEFERRLKELKVYCPNRKYGCQWQQTLCQVPEHLKRCEMTREASLPVEITPSGTVIMKSVDEKIDNLIREMKKMKEEIEQIKINQSNLNAMKDLIEERTESMRNEFDSKLEEFNENLKLNREKIENAEKQMSEEFRKNESKIMNSVSHFSEKNKFNSLIPMSDDLKHLTSLSYVWQVRDILQVLDLKKSETLSSVFPLPGYPFGAQARLKLQDDWVYVSLCFKELLKEDLKFEAIPRVSYVLKDRTGSEHSKDRMRSISPLFNTSFSALRYDKFYYETVIDRHSKLRQTTYLEDESVVLEVHVEPPCMARQVASTNGILISSIAQYRKKRRMALEELVLNQDGPYFYTGPKGYKILARMGLNGHEAFKGKGLSLSISFLTGEFDATLTRSFRHRTYVTLFNLKDPTKHVTKSVEQTIDKNLQYIIDVATNAEIESFIDNDVLYYKVQIRERPWWELENHYQIMYKVGMGETPEIPENLNDEGQDFLGWCFRFQPRERWTAIQLLGHPFTKVYSEEDYHSMPFLLN